MSVKWLARMTLLAQALEIIIPAIPLIPILVMGINQPLKRFWRAQIYSTLITSEVFSLATFITNL